ncbi:MAG: hypothetical protein ACI9Y1_003556 [Lentisphaeria bacterium]|jgi:hypothetical protein
MKHIVFVWEVGPLDAYSKQIGFAQLLLDKGYAVTYVVTGLHEIYLLSLDSRIQILQAPIWPLRHRSSSPCCIPEVLLVNGYNDPNQLKGLVAAWQGLFNALRPDVVLFDYAPTALVAAQAFKFYKIACGGGVGELVPGVLSADLMPFSIKPNDRIDVSERRVLSTINAVNKSLDVPLLDHLGDLYLSVDDTIICTVPEMDIYRKKRTTVNYVGAQYGCWRSQSLTAISWTDDEHRPKVIIYLKKPSRHFHRILVVLSHLNSEVIVFSPQVKALDVTVYPALKLYSAADGFDIQANLSQCDILICEGGRPLSLAIMAGVPTLVAPVDFIQNTEARMAEDLGFCRVLRESDDDESTHQKLLLLLRGQAYLHESAKLFDQYVQLSGEASENRMLAIIEELF